MDWALEELLQGPDDPMVIKNGHATDYIDQLHEMLNEHHPPSDGLVVNLLPPPTADENSVSSINIRGTKEEDDLLPVLSPPEGYRDGPLPPPLLPLAPPPMSPEDHHRRSMTHQQRLDNNTCPEEASSSTSQQQLQDQHLLPGQQDSGPQATFPYHYLQHQDEASTTSSAISHDLEEDANKKVILKTREPEENHPPKFFWGSSQNSSSSSTPILSSMLASEPSNLRHTGQIPAYISIEHDSGIESLDSLSPKDIDNTPLNSPEVVASVPTPTPSAIQIPPGKEPSILTSLLSAPPTKEPSSLSQSMLSTLLTCSTSSQKAVNEVAKINVVTINPHNMTLVNQGETQEMKVESTMDVTVQVADNHELSLAEFLDGCAKVANETTSVVRSTLEDIVVTDEKNKTNFDRSNQQTQLNQNEVPEKHEEFDNVMCQTLGKVVPEWDTDLNFRLRQLDTVLATKAVSKSANSTSDEDDNHPVEKQKRYACASCDATFNSCGARNSHRRKVHERFHLCRDCDMAFGSAQKLERHMKTHSGVKEFKCETCGKEFMIERNLTLHYKLHLGQKDFICSVCSRTYYTKSGLQAHIRQLHAPPSKSQELFCKQCLQKFLTRHELNLHRKQVHVGDAFGEKCSQCPMIFRTLTELKRHNISEHSNRPFACSHCPHRSKTKDKLDRHLLCHTGPRESYQCQHCEKKFVFKNSLKKHLEKGRCDVLKQQKRISEITEKVRSELEEAYDISRKNENNQTISALPNSNQTISTGNQTIRTLQNSGQTISALQNTNQTISTLQNSGDIISTLQNVDFDFLSSG